MIRRIAAGILFVLATSGTCWCQLPGDVDGDGVITSDDMDLVCGASEFSAELDLDGDGTHTKDFEFLLELTGFLPGDTNFDGLVQFKDFVKHSANFGKFEAVWSDGDFDCDGVVAFADFLEIANNYGEFPDHPTNGISAVPEPSGLGVLAAACVTLFVFRRNRPRSA